MSAIHKVVNTHVGRVKVINDDDGRVDTIMVEVHANSMAEAFTKAVKGFQNVASVEIIDLGFLQALAHGQEAPILGGRGCCRRQGEEAD